MKRTNIAAFGSPCSAFAPAMRRHEERPQLQQGRPPLLRPLARRAPTWIVWPSPDPGAGPDAVRLPPYRAPGVAARPLQDDELVSSAGEVLRLSIRRGHRRQIEVQLACPYAADAALTLDPQGRNSLWHALDRGDEATAIGLLQLSSAGEQALQPSDLTDMPLMMAARRGMLPVAARLLQLDSACEQLSRILSALGQGR